MAKDNDTLEVSIVLACYNAESFVEDSFKQIREVMESTRFSYEIVFVDDHSSDKSVSLVRRIIKSHPNCKLIVHRKNAGRGKTVYDGIRNSKGAIVGFIDLDLDNPARYIFSMILGIKNGGVDVCTAQRVYKWKWGIYFIMRLLLSLGYARFSSWILQTQLRDSETGCKFFRREKILPVLSETKNRGWFWDTEIMTRAHYRNLKILEIPTLFVRNTRVTTVDFIPETLKYIWSVFKFIPIKNKLREEWVKNNRRRIF